MILDRFGKPCACLTNANHRPCLVRIQDYVDADVPSSADDDDGDDDDDERASREHHHHHTKRMTAADVVWDKIDSARRKMARTAGVREEDVRLYPRRWTEVVSPFNTKAGSLVDSSKSPSSSFTVATFNSLAKGLSSGPADLFPTPFSPRETSEDESSFARYGGFIGVSSPGVVFDYDVRKWRLLHVLLGGGLLPDDDDVRGIEHRRRRMAEPAFDILALQEVDEYESFFRPVLLLLNSDEGGYRGTFQPKPNSPCVPLGWYSDGVALLWNAEKFPNATRREGVAWIEGGSFEGRRAKDGCRDRRR